MEAVEDDGKTGTISDWTYYKTQEAQLDNKIRMLQVAEVDEKTGKVNLPQDVLAGPGVYGQKWNYKLQTRGNVMLRPMVCLGPDRAKEWTILARAIEKDWKLIPSNAADIAEARRQQVVAKKRERFTLLDVK